MQRAATTCAAITMLAMIGFTAPAFAGDRTAEEILKDYRGVEMPAYDQEKGEDEAYVEQYLADRQAALEQQAAFILELYRAHPDHEQVETLMPRRWTDLYKSDTKTVKAEIAEVIADAPDSQLAVEGRYCIAEADVQSSLWGTGESDVAAAAKAAEVFISAVPDDERGARLLGWVVRGYEAGSTEQLAIYKRIKKQWPDSLSAKYVDGKIRAVEGIGKPFELAFTDAISGTEISMEQLRGQVVVLDFWATWCGPCIAEMPHMKELYAQYHEQGVQFLGVSLDRPEERAGLTDLKAYVADNEIPWPQFYQGNGWDSAFSVSWGVNGIPALFIVDKQGNLHSTEARGELETLIPELLAK